MEQVISDYIRDIYQKARADSLLMLCAALAFAAGAALLVWAFQRHRPAYLFHKTTKKTFHYAFMAMVALLCVLRFSGGGSALKLTLSLLAVLFAAVGIYGLITWRPLGVGLSLVSVWLSLPMGELATVLGAASDVRNTSEETTRVCVCCVLWVRVRECVGGLHLWGVQKAHHQRSGAEGVPQLPPGAQE